jgi:hypothetical protein
MSIIRDESLQEHAKTVQAAYDASVESLVEFTAEREAARVAPGTTGGGIPLVGSEDTPDPWENLPREVANAKEEYETALNVRLKFLKYSRARNGELEDAADNGARLPDDTVQLTRSITVSSTQGAIVILEQWLSEAEPAGENND